MSDGDGQPIKNKLNIIEQGDDERRGEGDSNSQTGELKREREREKSGRE